MNDIRWCVISPRTRQDELQTCEKERETVVVSSVTLRMLKLRCATQSCIDRVQEGAEHTTLRSSCADGERGGCEAAIRTSRIRLHQRLSRPRSCSLVGMMVLNAELLSCTVSEHHSFFFIETASIPTGVHGHLLRFPLRHSMTAFHPQPPAARSFQTPCPRPHKEPRSLFRAAARCF